ncbi:MAG: sodium-dependent bicarbonate transport family permease [Cyanobacteria bacterium J06633_2]
MDFSLILANILNPPVLFFFLGMAAVFLKSDLEIPAPIPKLFSLYLLFAIGFKGGHELHESGLNAEIMTTLVVAVVMATIVPIYSFFILRLKLDACDAAAIAAAYGSISAVTFVTATSFLDRIDVSFGGHMVAALALMESPAIIAGLILVRLVATTDAETNKENFAWSTVFQEAFLNGSVFLLVGSLLVGLVTSQQGWESLEPFTGDIFYGVLTFFLLDMGLIAAQRFGDLLKSGTFVIGFSVLMPLLNASIGIGIAFLLQLSMGNTLLFAVLCASASYIAVPAAMRLTVPEANPSLYISMALALTFPFNIIVGIPIYFEIIQYFWV